jgi:FkbM family methyltransferase
VQAKNAYALEPDPYAYDELRANVALNPSLQDHTWIYWKCIMDKPGIYPMGGGGGDSMASVGTGTHSKSWKVHFLHAEYFATCSRLSGSTLMTPLLWQVDCMTLPQFIDEHKIENLDLIKMDPEGAEHIILPAFKSWLVKQTVRSPTLCCLLSHGLAHRLLR